MRFFTLEIHHEHVSATSHANIDRSFHSADVDNMRSKAGTSATDKASFESLIDGIEVMVAILTGSIRQGEEYSDYFKSTPCLHELNRALDNCTPVVFVLESTSSLQFESTQASTLFLVSAPSVCYLIPPSAPRPQLTRTTVASHVKRIGEHAQNICYRC